MALQNVYDNKSPFNQLAIDSSIFELFYHPDGKIVNEQRLFIMEPQEDNLNKTSWYVKFEDSKLSQFQKGSLSTSISLYE